MMGLGHETGKRTKRWYIAAYRPKWQNTDDWPVTGTSMLVPNREPELYIGVVSICEVRNLEWVVSSLANKHAKRMERFRGKLIRTYPARAQGRV